MSAAKNTVRSGPLCFRGGKVFRLLLSLLPIPLLLLFHPLGLSSLQCFLLGALIVTIIWWVSGLVERTIASLALLAVFLVFSGASPAVVFTFPRSENFVMIVVSFLFSQGVANSGLAERFLLPLLLRYARTLGRLMALMALSALAMIFIIPQPFSRIIILSLIFKRYFDKIKLEDGVKSALLFALFLDSAFLNMLLFRGDMILNGALISMGGIPVSEAVWMRYMTVPTLLFTLLATVLFLVVFRRDLSDYRVAEADMPQRGKLGLYERWHLILILAVVVFWALEPLHGISGTIIVCAGTAVMFLLGLLRPRDLKTINLKLLVFLTAAFSIGGVLKNTGIADILFRRLSAFFPSSFSLGYAALVLAVSMSLHMILGSNVTTMSVVVPGLMTVGAGVVPGEVMLFLIYLGICGHFILPFHHVLLLLGEGDGCYTSRQMIRFGVPLTFVTWFCGLFLYLGWWRLTGLL